MAAAPAPTPPLVLHVLHQLRMGGMENGLVNLINHMPPGRWRHAVVCMDGYSDFRARIQRPEVPVLALQRDQVGVGAARRALYRLCRQWRPAVVHGRNLSGLDALLPAWLAGVPTRVHSEHGLDIGDLDGRNRRHALLRRLHAPLVSRYITVSRDLAGYLQQRVGIAPGRIRQIGNGVDTARFQPRPEARAQALPAGFAGPGDFVVGTVGRAHPIKDQATLVEAFARLCARAPALAPRLRLVVAGDGVCLPALQQLAAARGVAARCWLPGALTQVPPLLAALDAFVLPSLNEGISNTILEAMASGLPVAVTAVGGNRELVHDGTDGRFFQPGDADALAAILLDWAGHPARAQALGAAARRRVLQHHSLAAMVAAYAAVYEGA